MKNRILILAMIIIIAITFAACTNNNKTVQASSDAAVNTEADETAEKLIPDLYPAYIMEGSEKMWGYINEVGTYVIQPRYESAGDFQSIGMAQVMENGSWSLIDKTGKTIMESQYLYTSDFSEGKIIVTNDSGKSYLLDKKGGILFETKGSIGKLSCGLAPFGNQVDNEKAMWGYIDAEGKVVIEPKYQWAQDFSKDKAIVKISEGHFGIIDKDGKLLKQIDSNLIRDLAEDIFVFSKRDADNSEKYGYMTVDGTVILDAVYSDAQKYEDGLAVVNAAKDYGNEFGVIDTTGKFVIPAKYAQITSLGSGLYAVPEAHEDIFNISYVKKALFDKNGSRITELSYYDLERLDNGLISATDDKNTYLLDEKGRVVNSLPKVEGIGSIRPLGKLYKVEADNELYYLSQEGKTVWKSDNTIRLDGGLEIKMKTFRPDRCMLIQYPELSGLSDTKVLEDINGVLKDKFVGNNTGSSKSGELYTDSIEVGYTAGKNKDLLIISKDGYYYPIGAAHGQPDRVDYHIDLRTAKLYTLADLFKKDSGYKEKLAEIIKRMIVKTNKEFGDQMYSEDIGDWEDISGFALEKNSLQIYFYPYAIAAYAAGFPEFNISYDELKDLINTEGELWKAFDRDPSAITEKPGDEVSTGERVKIEETMKNYENTLVEAINKNDFKLVEPWLYPDSSLYTAQKQLVADLNRKKIQERLDSYVIESIKASSPGIIRVYVTENISIKYPGKDFTSKQFKWIYSMRYDYGYQKYLLTYIDKW